MRILHGLLFVILLCREWRGSDTQEAKILRSCISQNTCETCLQADSSCAWCSDWVIVSMPFFFGFSFVQIRNVSFSYSRFQSYSNLTVGRPRCNSPERLKQFGCPPREIRTPSPGSRKFLEDSNFQDMEPERVPIQLRPQRVAVKIPPNSEITISIRYRLAKYV